MIKKHPFRRSPIPAMLIAVNAIAFGAPVYAQSKSATLEEVVVTAQRREGSLQSTPISMSAFTSSKLDDLGVFDVANIGSYSPNVSIEQTPNTNSGMGVFIRGIGTSETALTVDPKIGLYINDIYMSKTMGSVFDIVDIERVEVLRGPQGTLFGRNTTGGAINVSTVKPKGEFGVKAEASMGRFGYQRYGASVDLPAVANVSTKLAYYTMQTDGWATNHWDGPPMAPADKVYRDLGSEDNDAYQIALRWVPSDNLTIDYSFDKTNNKGVPHPFQTIAVKDSLYDGFTTTPFPFELIGGDMYQQMAAQIGDPNKRKEDFNLDSHTEEWLDVTGHALVVAWQLDEVTLKYILGHRETATGYAGADYGGVYFAPDAFYGGGATVQVPEYSAAVDSEIEMTTHEFQIFGTTMDSKLDYTAGVFFYDEDISQDQPQTFTLPILFVAPGTPLFATYEALGFCDSGTGMCTGTQRLPLPFPSAGADPNLNGVSDLSYGQKMESWAIYGQTTYALTDTLSLTTGLRYTEEKRKAYLFNESLGHLSFADRLQANDKWDNISGVINLSYQVTPDAMVYAKYSTGFNGGTYNARASSVSGFMNPADEETVKSMELGLKSEWFDNRLRLNAAVFRNDYTDIQITQFEAGTGGASSRLVNAGEGTYQGVEFDITAIPVDGLTIDLTYGYLDAKFDEYLARNPATDREEDISGVTTVPHAPKNTGALGIQYEFPQTAIGVFSVRADATYKDSFVFHPFQNQFDGTKSRTLINARISLSEIPLGNNGRNRLRVSLWGKNLTDEEYRRWGIDFGSLGWAGALYGEPLTYGLDVRYEYE